MQSHLLDGVGSTYGAYRVLPPLQETNTPKNSSHIHELYRNLPQLPKPHFLPVSYNSYEPQNNLEPYSEQQQLRISSRPSFLYSKLQPNNHNGKHRYPKHHPEQELEKDQQMMYKRNGWGWDAGHGHQHKHGNQPALSALALLGFMFFLNLIQNSLQNNRQMLAAAALNATTVSVVAGRENKYGYRLKRGIKDENEYTLPVYSSTPSFMAREGYSTIGKTGLNKEKSHNREHQVKFVPGSKSQNTSSSSSSKNVEKDFLNAKLQHNPIEILKSSSVHCCQLVACKLGESIYDSFDTTTGFMIRMLGSTMITRVPRKTWTGKLLRALDKGWKKESCDHLYRNCGALYKLFYNVTNGGPVRRKRKY